MKNKKINFWWVDIKSFDETYSFEIIAETENKAIKRAKKRFKNEFTGLKITDIIVSNLND